VGTTEVLRHLSLIPQDVPDIVDAGESLQKVYVRHFPEDGGLSVVELSVEEQGYVETISEALTAPGSQAAFDPSRLIGIVTFLAKRPELWAAIFGLFKKG
jgi:hypothetical protein